MKKSILVLAIILLNLNLTSCTKESISEEIQTEENQDCCGEDGDILPPPPNNG